MPPLSALLDADHLDFIRGPVSIIAASAGAGGIPQLGRACGCRVDGEKVVILLAASQSGALLGDVRANGRVAVVFSRPTSHRTLQLKGGDAAIAALAAEDPALVTRYRGCMVTELAQLGYDRDFVGALFGASLADLVAIVFTPTAAFSQTPGPGAGAPLPPPAAPAVRSC